MIEFESNVEGRGSKRRSPKRWTDKIRTITGYTLLEPSHQAQDTESWTVVVDGMLLLYTHLYECGKRWYVT